MPVQIVGNKEGKTSTDDGTIKIADLHTMVSEYQDHVGLTAIPPRNAIIKRNSFYFTKAQILALFEEYANNAHADTIEIAIGVQVPDTVTNCPESKRPIDNADCISVIISMTNQMDRKPLNSVDDHVLINGYHPSARTVKKSLTRSLELAMCCPGSKPPPPPTLQN